MLGLGLRLAFRSGREAFARLILTTVAVMIGVMVLLFGLANFHAFQATSNRPCWECTAKGQQRDQRSLQGASDAAVWLFRKDGFRGEDIKRLDVAALGLQAPMLPGISRLPDAGQYYASPALAELLRTTPREELGDRFPGSQAGIIGDAALAHPDELVIYVGRTPAEVSISPKAFHVNTIATAPKAQESTALLRFAFAIGAVGLLFPMLILIMTATRLSAARREERFAALRLVGATPRQINVIASVDAVLGATVGVVLGVGAFVLFRPLIADIALSDTRFFTKDITPTIFGYGAVLIGVPLAAAAAALASLRRVRISPLGISRKVTPPAPKIWLMVPFLLGLPLFIGAALLTEGNDPTAPIAIPGFVLVMIGLITGGPWLTMQATRFLARRAKKASSLLAARQLADNPKAAFRSVSGLVLAVFVGTLLVTIAPTGLEVQSPKADALSSVLTVGFYDVSDEALGGTEVKLGEPEGLSPEDGDKLLGQLQTYSGVSVFPIYSAPLSDLLEKEERMLKEGKAIREGQPDLRNQIISCDSLRQLAVLGQCPAGAEAIKVEATPLVTDHETDTLVQPDFQTTEANYSGLPLHSVLVRVQDASSLEKVRTLLAHNATSTASEVPRTFDEVRQDELGTVTNVQRIVYAAIAITLLVAGCSLAVAVGGSLVERKRPFTLLRLSGAPISVLYKAVLLESVVPLLVVTLIAAGTGFGLAAAMIKTLAPAGTPIDFPTFSYYLTMTAGLVVSLIVVAATLPLLNRITKPENAHFE